MCCFFFNDTATTEIYTLSLHDALPISVRELVRKRQRQPEPDRDELHSGQRRRPRSAPDVRGGAAPPRSTARKTLARPAARRSEEHTSELQSRQYLVCRLLLEKKKNNHL